MRIGVVAPARRIEEAQAARVLAFAAVTMPQHDIVFHPQCFLADGHFAGSDDQRADAFLEFANDRAFDGIWFARGGYGSNRILKHVMQRLGPAARAKRYCGYSDMGFLLAALYAQRIGRVAHGPMTGDLGTGAGDATIARSLLWLTGSDAGIEPGLDARPAAAFNLSILAALIGTKWLPDLTDHVLMIEDVGEPLYRFDRMLFQMAHAQQLRGVAGVRLGGFTNVVGNDVPFGTTTEQMIVRWCGEMGVPYLGPCRISHGRDNHVVPFGMRA